MSTITERLYSRVQNMVATMKITATNDSGPVHRAQVKGFPPEQIDDMPVLQLHGFASHAPVGTDAMAIFTSGDRSNGVVIATGSQKHRPRETPSGGTVIYDTSGTTILLDAAGKITITCSDAISVKADSVTIKANKVRMETPRLEVTGDVIAGCDSTHVSVLNHRHKDTEPGGGLSGVPQPT
jgi:phage baseplate assembly protein V